MYSPLLKAAFIHPPPARFRMDEEQLKARIRCGEDSQTEFKSARVHVDSLAKELTAFLNSGGGMVFVGIEDDGQISGDIPAGFEEKVVQICRNNIQPSFIPMINLISISSKTVMRISVPDGKNKPYKVKSSNKYYIRAGSCSVEPTQEELVRLFQRGELLHFETGTIPHLTLASLDLPAFTAYCRDQRKLSVDDSEIPQFLENFQLTESGVPTIAALLSFGRSIRRALPQAGIQMVAIDGHNLADDLLSLQEYDGTAHQCIYAAENFVRMHSRVVPVFNEDQTRRTDIHDFEPTFVREILVNAFAHRDWSIFGQCVRLRVFKDRLELFSPGGLPNSLTPLRALSGVSYYRNPIIAQILRDYGLSERTGRGLARMMHSAREQGMRIPEFVCETDSVTVILFRRNPPVN